jgi:hypothetical protein
MRQAAIIIQLYDIDGVFIRQYSRLIDVIYSTHMSEGQASAHLRKD